MASDTMELECPSCKTMLEIDKAFAGGVCRCSNCGTLMTVPRDPQHEQAESLTRPDSPNVPAPGTQQATSERPVRPDAPSGSQTPAPTNTPPVDNAPTSEPRLTSPTGQPVGQPLEQPAAAPAGASMGVQEGVYVTASGKQVHITSQTRIPTATKRKALKIGIVSGFVILMVGMVLIVVIGIGFMLKPATPKRTASQVAADVQKARGNYNPDINPYLLASPNVLGLQLADSVVVVLDTSKQGQWLSMAASAISQGVAAKSKADDSKKNTGPLVQVIFARDGGPVVTPDKISHLTAAQKETLRDTLDHIRPLGQAQLGPALMLAMQSSPAQIILITSQDISETNLGSITGELAKSKTPPQLDVVYLGDQPGELADVVSKHQGTLVTLPVVRLSAWYQAWLDKQQPDQ